MPPHAAWLDRFFVTYYQHHPVDATFIGVHDYDDQLPDLSDNGLADLVAAMETLLATCPPEQPADPTLALDCQLARDFLTIQIAECRGTHFWRSNPSLHVGEAIFGGLESAVRRSNGAPGRRPLHRNALDACRAQRRKFNPRIERLGRIAVTPSGQRGGGDYKHERVARHKPS